MDKLKYSRANLSKLDTLINENGILKPNSF